MEGEGAMVVLLVESGGAHVRDADCKVEDGGMVGFGHSGAAVYRSRGCPWCAVNGGVICAGCVASGGDVACNGTLEFRTKNKVWTIKAVTREREQWWRRPSQQFVSGGIP